MFEAPLILRDLEWFTGSFSEIKAETFDILNLMPKRKKLASVLTKVDDAMLQVMPGLRNCCRYVVVKLVK